MARQTCDGDGDELRYRVHVPDGKDAASEEEAHNLFS